MPKTKEQVLSKLKQRLPDFISLDESTYTRFDKPAKFIDFEYGEYWMSPKNASKGQKHKERGYKERIVANRLTIDEVISRLPSYVSIDPSTYKDTHTKARFIDSTYGEFWHTFNGVMNGKGHSKRGRLATIAAHKYSDNQANAALPKGILLKPGTYKKSTDKAIFVDPNTKEEFVGTFASVRDGKKLPPSMKVLSRAKARKTKMENGLMNILPNGKYVSEYCKEFADNPSPSSANFIYHAQGPEAAQQWIEGHATRGSNIEIGLMRLLGIERFNQFPEADLRYRPDFKLNERLFLNADGLYWHSEDKKGQSYHFKLREEFEKKNLRILQFRQDEILTKANIVKSIINNAMGSSSIKINARDCAIGTVEPAIAKEFLMKNHIKGFHRSCKYIGLFDDTALISVIGFKIIQKKLKIERFCSEIGYSIRGALGKLLAAVSKACLGQYQEIHYWVDLRYGTGNSLSNLGFIKDHETLGFDWTDGHQTYNRLKCKANMDERGLSEAEHAKELGWYKIYDAGQRLFVKYVN